MQPRLAAFAAALVITWAAASVPVSTTVEGPPLGFTGGFGEPTCVQCHIGNEINAYGGRVSVEGLPEAFEPGAEYVLTILLQAEETEVAGFELSARYAGGRLHGLSAGALRAADLRVAVRDSAGVSYAHHSRDGSPAPSPDGSSWTVLWTAPKEPTPVAFSVAANSGNADNSPLSDLVYTNEVVVPPSR
jgi:hypothetical protein